MNPVLQRFDDLDLLTAPPHADEIDFAELEDGYEDVEALCRNAGIAWPTSEIDD